MIRLALTISRVVCNYCSALRLCMFNVNKKPTASKIILICGFYFFVIDSNVHMQERCTPPRYDVKSTPPSEDCQLINNIQKYIPVRSVCLYSTFILVRGVFIHNAIRHLRKGMCLLHQTYYVYDTIRLVQYYTRTFP